MNNTDELMSSKLQAEAEAVFDFWKRNGLYERAFSLVMISKQAISPLMAEVANQKFQYMYDQAVNALKLTPVLSPAEQVKPKYAWRNGARVKVL